MGGGDVDALMRNITKVFVEPVVVYSFLRILWIVMLVMAAACAWQAVTASVAAEASDQASSIRMFEAQAAKEGALVLTLDLVVMIAILSVHQLSDKFAKLKMNFDVMKKQATQQGEFSKQLLQASDKKATDGVPAESKMPEGKQADQKENSGDAE